MYLWLQIILCDQCCTLPLTMDSTDTGCSYSFDSYKSRSGTSLNYSTDINAISVDLPEQSDEFISTYNGLKYLPRWPAVNIDFHNLTYKVPVAGKGKIFYIKNAFYCNQYLLIESFNMAQLLLEINTHYIQVLRNFAHCIVL